MNPQDSPREVATFSLKDMIEAQSIAPEIRKRSSPVDEMQQQQQPKPHTHVDPASFANSSATEKTMTKLETKENEIIAAAAAAAVVAAAPAAPALIKPSASSSFATSASPSSTSRPTKSLPPEVVEPRETPVKQKQSPAPTVSKQEQQQQQQQQQQAKTEVTQPNFLPKPRPKPKLKQVPSVKASVAAPGPDDSVLEGAVFSPMESSSNGANSHRHREDLEAAAAAIVSDNMDGFAQQRSGNNNNRSRSPTPHDLAASAGGASVVSTVSEAGDDNTSHRPRKKAEKRLHQRTDSGPAVGALVSIPAVEGGGSASATPSAASVISSAAAPSTPVARISKRFKNNLSTSAIVPIPAVSDENPERGNMDDANNGDASNRNESGHHAIGPTDDVGDNRDTSMASGILPAPLSRRSTLTPTMVTAVSTMRTTTGTTTAAAAEATALSDAQLLGPFLHLHGAMTTALGGLCVVGPQPRVLAATCAMIGVPFLMLAAGVFPHLSAGLIFMDVIFTALTFAFLFKTAFTDPGFVPKRADSSTSDFDPSAEQRITLFWSTKGTGEVDSVFGSEPVPASPARERAKLMRAAAAPDDDDDGEADEVKKKTAAQQQEEQEFGEESVKSFPFRIRYCRTCNRYRAPRTFHCDVCRACVDVYDHHCSFTGTCIGAHNYAPFLGFMFSLQCSIIFYFISVVAGPVDLSTRAAVCLSDAMTMMGWMPVLIIIVIFLIAFGPSGLLILQVYLASTGTTTMEHLREKWGEENPNPFDRGFVRNWLRALGAQDPACWTEKYDPFIVAFERSMRKFAVPAREAEEEPR